MQSEPEEWQETFNTNLTGQFFITAALLPLLEKGRELTPGYSSSVVNVASISGVMKGTSMGQFAYATSKAGKLASARPNSMLNVLAVIPSKSLIAAQD